MLKILATHLLAISVLASASKLVQGQELLQDTSFDATDIAAQTNPFWTLDTNLPGDGGEPAARYQDAPWASNPAGSPGIGIWNRAFDGTPENPAEANIFQDVDGQPGFEYTLSAFYRAESFYTSLATVVGMEFLQGDVVLDNVFVDLNGLAPNDGAWNEYVVVATAPAGTETVRAYGRMVQGIAGEGNPQSSMFDDFSLTAVPEPSSGLMFLILACLSVARCRGNRDQPRLSGAWH